MDELDSTEVPTVGERLRAAREKMKLSLDDVAAQTRIPRRHLESVEESDWERLPAPTYTIGFAKSYASAVGLDRMEIGEDLRSEMGGARAPTASTEVFEPADPARTMPRWLVLAAVLAVVLVILVMSWLSNRSLHDDNDVAQPAATAPAPTQPGAALSPRGGPSPASTAQGPVVLTATQPVWLAIKDGGRILKQGIMQPGETYEVPGTAIAPILTTAKSEGLKITVGNAVAPPAGPPATKVSVSLLPSDILKGPQSHGTAAATPGAPPQIATSRTHRQARPVVRREPPSAVAPQTSPSATANTAQ